MRRGTVQCRAVSPRQTPEKPRQTLGIQGFLEEGDGAGTDRMIADPGSGCAGHHDHVKAKTLLYDDIQELQTVDARQHQIKQQAGILDMRPMLEERLARGKAHRLETLDVQQYPQRIPHRGVVIDYVDGHSKTCGPAPRMRRLIGSKGNSHRHSMSGKKYG